MMIFMNFDPKQMIIGWEAVIFKYKAPNIISRMVSAKRQIELPPEKSAERKLSKKHTGQPESKGGMTNEQEQWSD